MKILFITSYFPPIAGGSAVVYENLARHLGGDAVVLATWRHYVDGLEIAGWREYDGAQPFAVQRIELLRAPIRPAPKGMLGSAWRVLAEDLPLKRSVARSILTMVGELQPDVVVLGELYALAWVGELLRKRRGVPIVHYIHGEEITTFSGSRLSGRGALDSLRRAEAVVAVSSFTRRELVSLGVDPQRIHVITNGVDVARFTPGTKDPEILARHGLEGKRVLLTIARLEERKGHDKVIEALPAIAEKVPEVVYLVVGKGGYTERLRDLARDCGVADRVVFTGLVPWEDLVRYYRSCDAFIMPNRTLANGDTEGFGLVFLEANACGKPVIGGNAGGVPDAVADGETGILVDGTSAEQVAEAAIRLLVEGQVAAAMGSAGLEWAGENGWQEKAVQFRRLCQALTHVGARQS